MPTESELTIEEAVELVLTPEPDEEHADSNENVEEAVEPSRPQSSTVPMRNIIDLMHAAHEASMTRSDVDYITDGLWNLIQRAERQSQESRSIQSSIVSFLNKRQ